MEATAPGTSTRPLLPPAPVRGRKEVPSRRSHGGWTDLFSPMNQHGMADEPERRLSRRAVLDSSGGKNEVPDQEEQPERDGQATRDESHPRRPMSVTAPEGIHAEREPDQRE